MPLIIPKELPAFDELSRENVFVMHLSLIHISEPTRP